MYEFVLSAGLPEGYVIQTTLPAIYVLRNLIHFVRRELGPLHTQD